MRANIVRPTGRILVGLLVTLAAAASAQAGPLVCFDLPERFRTLVDQRFDLRIEARDLASSAAALHLVVNGQDVTSYLSAAEITQDNDAAPLSLDKAWTFRNVAFPTPGLWTLTASVSDGGGEGSAIQRIGVQPFSLHGRKNVVLFLGDAMGTAYRDAGRLVSRSTDNRFREGFFDELQEMDQMPVSGMVMTYALDRVVPDSANTATAWSTGNKTIDGALGVFPDSDDFRYNGGSIQATKQWALNNPRIETLWEYLKRRYGYKTGIVTTSDVTDATPAGEGAHTITRNLGYDIAKQFVDGSFTSGPTFDVILGGGKERFVSRTLGNSGDTRNLATELQARGFTYVQNRTELFALGTGSAAPERVLGLFRTSHMNVAYDKLVLSRPADEPAPSFGGFTDQPFLDEMTTHAIAALSRGGAPFILMVEGASIDKQSHPNHAAGVLWDTIEFDKAVGVGRAFAARLEGHRPARDTLVLVTADHDQSMSIIGLSDTAVAGAVQNVRSTAFYPNPGSTSGEAEGFPDYDDANGDGYPENTNRYRLEVGFRTGNHTGSSVPITAEGPGAFLFTGYFDQTDIFFKTAAVLAGNTAVLDRAYETLVRALPAVSPNY